MCCAQDTLMPTDRKKKKYAFNGNDDLLVDIFVVAIALGPATLQGWTDELDLKLKKKMLVDNAVLMRKLYVLYTPLYFKVGQITRCVKNATVVIRDRVSNNAGERENQFLLNTHIMDDYVSSVSKSIIGMIVCAGATRPLMPPTSKP